MLSTNNPTTLLIKVFCCIIFSKIILSPFQIAEFTKECSEKWRSLNSKDKKVFDDKAAADKERYDKEVQNYAGQISWF